MSISKYENTPPKIPPQESSIHFKDPNTKEELRVWNIVKDRWPDDEFYQEYKTLVEKNNILRAEIEWVEAEIKRLTEKNPEREVLPPPKEIPTTQKVSATVNLQLQQMGITDKDLGGVAAFTHTTPGPLLSRIVGEKKPPKEIGRAISEDLEKQGVPLRDDQLVPEKNNWGPFFREKSHAITKFGVGVAEENNNFLNARRVNLMGLRNVFAPFGLGFHALNNMAFNNIFPKPPLQGEACILPPSFRNTLALYEKQQRFYPKASNSLLFPSIQYLMSTAILSPSLHKSITGKTLKYPKPLSDELKKVEKEASTIVENAVLANPSSSFLQLRKLAYANKSNPEALVILFNKTIELKSRLLELSSKKRDFDIEQVRIGKRITLPPVKSLSQADIKRIVGSSPPQATEEEKEIYFQKMHILFAAEQTRDAEIEDLERELKALINKDAIQAVMSLKESVLKDPNSKGTKIEKALAGASLLLKQNPGNGFLIKALDELKDLCKKRKEAISAYISQCSEGGLTEITSEDPTSSRLQTLEGLQKVIEKAPPLTEKTDKELLGEIGAFKKRVQTELTEPLKSLQKASSLEEVKAQHAIILAYSNAGDPERTTAAEYIGAIIKKGNIKEKKELQELQEHLSPSRTWYQFFTGT